MMPLKKWLLRHLLILDCDRIAPTLVASLLLVVVGCGDKHWKLQKAGVVVDLEIEENFVEGYGTLFWSAKSGSKRTSRCRIGSTKKDTNALKFSLLSLDGALVLVEDHSPDVVLAAYAIREEKGWPGDLTDPDARRLVRTISVMTPYVLLPDLPGNRDSFVW